MRAREPLVVAGIALAEAAFLGVFEFINRRGEPQKSRNKPGVVTTIREANVPIWGNQLVAGLGSQISPSERKIKN